MKIRRGGGGKGISEEVGGHLELEPIMHDCGEVFSAL